MFVWDAVFALVIGLLLALLIATPTRRRETGAGWSLFFIFFLVLFLASWAGGLWVTPFGPAMFGVYWLPFLLIGLFVLVLLLALPPTITVRRAGDAARERQTSLAAMGAWFWVLIFILIGSIALAYAVS